MPEPIDSVIAEWTARLDEAERVARAATKPAKKGTWEPERWRVDAGGDLVTSDYRSLATSWEGDAGIRDEDTARHMALHDPSSVLEDIGRKRKVIQQYRVAEVERVEAWSVSFDAAERAAAQGRVEALEQVVRTLAGATEETT